MIDNMREMVCQWGGGVNGIHRAQIKCVSRQQDRDLQISVDFMINALKIPVTLKQFPCFSAILYFPLWSHTGEDI